MSLADLVSFASGTGCANGNQPALLPAPSVIGPEEQNAPINPTHPDAARITAHKVRKWLYDPCPGRDRLPFA